MFLLTFNVCFAENIALNKSAWQTLSYPYQTADLAVDGRTSNLSTLGGECALSWFSKMVEWRVDLGKVFSIQYLKIQYATNNQALGISNISKRFNLLIELKHVFLI